MSAVQRRTGIARHRTLITAVGIGLVAALSLTACSGTGAAPAPKPGEKVTYEDFTFTSWNYGEDAQKALIEQEVDGFTSQHDVEADLVSFPFAEYRNQLLLRSRDGSTTGAAQLDIADIQSMSRLGVLVDLSEYAKGVDYTEASLKNGQVDGKQYGLPWYTGSIGLIENKQLLEKAGITSAPTTVDEFEKALKAVKALGGDIVPYALATKPETIKDFIPWFKTFGSKVVDGDKIAVNDKGAVEALEWLTRLNEEGLISLGLGRPEARTLYSQGKTAFFDDANQVRGTLISQAADPALMDSTVPVARPVVKSGDAPQSLAWGGLIVVYKKGPTQTAAEFAKYYTSTPEVGINRYKEIGSVPTTETALADESFTSDPYASAWQTAITDTASPNPLWQFSNYSQMEAKLAEQIQAALTGQKSAQDALDTAQAAMQKLAD
ncbi:MAG: sugar ABC transporter substrate-binding protein [Microbacterium sp.]|jgi:multiple sugar transport system substrate-binding protein|nr:sugar ABC transporter substrate-binding protein [Microbacterium sp.]